MSEADPITNDADVIDSRDVIDRARYLRDLARDPETQLDDEERAELTALESLVSQGDEERFCDGETLIRDTYFVEYAQDLAEDIGAIDRNASWPHTCIDWEQAAREIRVDYTALDFDGVTYWARLD